MKPFIATGLIRNNILDLKPYASARSEFDAAAAVMLDANENPLGGAFSRYPDPLQKDLKQQLSRARGVDPGSIFIGNGSDEAIDLLIRICCRPGTADSILVCPPTYGMYEVCAATNDVPVVRVPLDAAFGLDVAAIRRALTPDIKLVFICSPNNPTGNLMGAEDLEAILDVAPGLVVIDEAYIDFAAAASWSLRLDAYPNLVVLHTCSKAWGLAGLRVGMAFAHPGLIAILNKVKPPYNVAAASQQLALTALRDGERYEANRRELLRQRERLEAALLAVPAIRQVFRSDANFLLVKVADASALYGYLLQAGIVVRNRHTTPGCENCLRISVGTEVENDQLISALRAFQS